MNISTNKFLKLDNILSIVSVVIAIVAIAFVFVYGLYDRDIGLAYIFFVGLGVCASIFSIGRKIYDEIDVDLDNYIAVLRECMIDKYNLDPSFEIKIVKRKFGTKVKEKNSCVLFIDNKQRAIFTFSNNAKDRFIKQVITEHIAYMLLIYLNSSSIDLIEKVTPEQTTKAINFKRKMLKMKRKSISHEKIKAALDELISANQSD